MRAIKYIIVILLIATSGIFAYKHSYNDKPVIKVAFHNMWALPSFNKRDIIKSTSTQIRLFFHPGDVLDILGFQMLHEIIAEHYNVEISNVNNADLIIDSVFGEEPIPNTKAVKIFFTGEAVKVRNPDNYDLAIGFDYIDHPNYIRVPLYYLYGAYDPKNVSTNYNRGTCNPHKPYFACFLYSNSGENNPARYDGAIARGQLFDKLSEYKRVEAGGRCKNNIGHRITQEDTMQWMSQCKFVISYENQTYEGYMTEKPMISYLSGAVPLYYGDRHAMQDINTKAIIFQGDFANQDAMIEYIKKVDNADALYCKIWDEKIIVDPSKNYEVVKARVSAKLNEALEKKLGK